MCTCNYLHYICAYVLRLKWQSDEKSLCAGSGVGERGGRGCFLPNSVHVSVSMLMKWGLTSFLKRNSLIHTRDIFKTPSYFTDVYNICEEVTSLLRDLLYVSLHSQLIYNILSSALHGLILEGAPILIHNDQKVHNKKIKTPLHHSLNVSTYVNMKKYSREQILFCIFSCVFVRQCFSCLCVYLCEIWVVEAS